MPHNHVCLHRLCFSTLFFLLILVLSSSVSPSWLAWMLTSFVPSVVRAQYMMLVLQLEVRVQMEPIAASSFTADLDPLASAVWFLRHQANDLHRSAFHISTDDGVRETTTANAKGLINQLLVIIKGCDFFILFFFKQSRVSGTNLRRQQRQKLLKGSKILWLARCCGSFRVVNWV